MKSRSPSEQTVVRWILAGYGQGELAAFKPLYYVRDVASTSPAYIVFCPQTGRIHHYLESIDFEMHMLCMFDPTTHDVRESYAALPWAETQEIACAQGIKHPTYPRGRSSSDVPWLLTATILWSRQHRDGIEHIAISVVPKDETGLPGPSKEWREACILSQYWASRGMRHLIIPKARAPRQKARNLIKFHRSLANHDEDDRLAPVEAFLEVAKRHLNADTPKWEAMNRISDALGISLAAAEIQLGRAIWQRHLIVDLSRPITAALPIHVMPQ